MSALNAEVACKNTRVGQLTMIIYYDLISNIITITRQLLLYSPMIFSDPVYSFFRSSLNALVKYTVPNCSRFADFFGAFSHLSVCVLSGL